MFTSVLFLVSLFMFHTCSTGLEKPWLDDIDGPKFLREAKQPSRAEDKDLDAINDLPREWTGVVRDSNIVFASSKNEQMICKVAAAPNGINTTTWNPKSTVKSPDATLASCRPFPTMVELPRGLNEHLYPASHVILHRCVGDCSQQIAFNCTVTSQEEIKYSVHVVDGLNFARKTFTVYNHTSCSCNCKTRESDCDLSKQKYTVESCSCQCKSNGSHCSVNHKWSSIGCQCKCANPPNCDCPQKVIDRCARKGKVLNKQKCECECPTPKPVCGPGTSFLKYNCTCV